MIELTLSEKQALAWSLLDDPQVVELDYGGAAGGGKSLLFCLWMTIRCRNYPGIREGIGRKELKKLKETTLVSLLREAFPLLNVKQHDYTYQDQKGLIRFVNGSEIILVDLARQPSDPDFDSLGSLNLTDVLIEEAAQITKKAKDAFSSRKNRWLNDKYGLTGKTVLGQNPSNNFTRQEYYEPYKALGAGDYQKWPAGQVEVNGELKTAYKAFVKALPTDNPFLSRNYIEVLNNLPPQERKRLRDGNWDYMDNEDMLYPSLLLDRSQISDRREGKKFIGVDVADKGKDKTLASLVEDNVLAEQRHFDIDKSGEKPLSELYALELIKFAQQRGFTPANAKDIAIEGNGVGVGMRDQMRSKGWFITEYVATSKSRSRDFYAMSQDMDKGDFQVYSQLETLTELRKQLQVLTFEFNESLEPVVLAKKKVKEVLGYSPDESDSARIAHWISKGGDTNAQDDASRLSW